MANLGPDPRTTLQTVGSEAAEAESSTSGIRAVVRSISDRAIARGTRSQQRHLIALMSSVFVC